MRRTSTHKKSINLDFGTGNSRSYHRYFCTVFRDLWCATSRASPACKFGKADVWKVRVLFVVWFWSVRVCFESVWIINFMIGAPQNTKKCTWRIVHIHKLFFRKSLYIYTSSLACAIWRYYEMYDIVFSWLVLNTSKAR